MKSQIVNSTLVEQIRTVLREDIVSLRLKPGEKLTVDALADRFGVSRTPVRDGLNALVEEGLVVVAPRVGYYVVELTLNDIHEICGIRKMMEIYAMQSASESDVLLNRVDEMLEEHIRVRQLSGAIKQEAFEGLDKEFHNQIIHASGNGRLIDIFMRTNSFVDLMRNLNTRVETAIEEHISMLQALQRKDTESATRLLEIHLDLVEEAIAEQMIEESRTNRNEFATGR